MSLNQRRILACFLIAAFGAIGCSKKERVEENQQVSGGSQTPAPVDSGSMATPPASEPAIADTAGTITEIFTRLHEHESSLSQIIVAGHWSALAAETSKIRELVAAASKLMRVPADLKPELELHVSEAARLSKALDQAGKTGDAAESKAQNADLQKELGALERMTVRPGD